MEAISLRGERLSGARLTSEFEESGCVKLPKMLSPELVEKCRRCFQKTLSNPAVRLTQYFAKDKETGESYFYNEASGVRGAEALFEELFAGAPVFAKTCRALWGSESVWFYDHEIFHKVGGREQHKRTPFHQDGAVIPFHGPHLVNIWIPLEDFTPKENCLEVVVGSHRGPLYLATGLAAANGDGSDIQVKKKPAATKPAAPARGGAPPMRLPLMPRPGSPEFAKWEIAQWELEKGDVLLLHSNCVHGGGRLSSAFPERNTLVLRFFGDACTYRELPRFRQAEGYRAEGARAGTHFSLTGPYPCLLGPGLAGIVGDAAAAAEAGRVYSQNDALRAKEVAAKL